MIRKYQPQDLEHIMKIWLETNLAAHGFIPAEYWNEQYEAVKEALPQADILIYEEEGQFLDFWDYRTVISRDFLWEKASRSRGIGRLLLEAAKSGRQELTLHAYAENTGAVRFYEREGFQTAAFEKEETTGREGVLMRWTREEEKTAFKKRIFGV